MAGAPPLLGQLLLRPQPVAAQRGLQGWQPLLLLLLHRLLLQGCLMLFLWLQLVLGVHHREGPRAECCAEWKLLQLLEEDAHTQGRVGWRT